MITHCMPFNLNFVSYGNQADRQRTHDDLSTVWKSTYLSSSVFCPSKILHLLASAIEWSSKTRPRGIEQIKIKGVKLITHYIQGVSGLAPLVWERELAYFGFELSSPILCKMRHYISWRCFLNLKLKWTRSRLGQLAYFDFAFTYMRKTRHYITWRCFFNSKLKWTRSRMKLRLFFTSLSLSWVRCPLEWPVNRVRFVHYEIMEVCRLPRHTFTRPRALCRGLFVKHSDKHFTKSWVDSQQKKDTRTEQMLTSCLSWLKNERRENRAADDVIFVEC
jgi:hypothetical protein